MGALPNPCICHPCKSDIRLGDISVSDENKENKPSVVIPRNNNGRIKIRSATIEKCLKNESIMANLVTSGDLNTTSHFITSPKCEDLLIKITKQKKNINVINYNYNSDNNINNNSFKQMNTHGIPNHPKESISISSRGLSFEPKLINEHIISKEEENNIKNTLSNHFLFQDLNDDVLQIILNELCYFIYAQNIVIYEQGDEGNFFYILAEGKIKSISYSNGVKNEKVYSKWTCFGELSLISKSKREESLTSLTQIAFFILDGESFREIQKTLTEHRLRDRYNFLNTISIFKPLENIPKYNVALKLKQKIFKPNEKIIIYGEVGETLYIIKEGLVSCRIGLKEIRKLIENDYFGQNAILIDMKRSCDVIALNNTICYEISREDLIDALGPDYIKIILFSFFKNCINSSKYLKDVLIDSKLLRIFECFKINRYKYKESITSSKIISNQRLLIIIDGGLYREKEKDKNYEKYAGKGDIIGESILQGTSQELPNDIIAFPDCIAFESDITPISNILDSQSLLSRMNTHKSNGIKNLPFPKKSSLNILKRISKVKKINIFKYLSENTIERIVNGMTKQKFKQNEIIVEEGSLGDSFYIITKGRVRVSMEGRTLRDLESGNCFGEIALLNPGVKRTATVVSIEKEVVCYVLSKKEFDYIITDDTIKEHMKKQIALRDTSIELKNLHFIKFLGKGKFGNVNLVHNGKNIYAIKAVSRQAVENQKLLAKYFINERRVMLSLDHPFIVKMVKTLRNESYCFFLMEYIEGKNLDEHISSNPIRGNIESLKFYIGSLLLIIDYLQIKFIAHRDIKPSNIMIDSNGYIKMIDFGTAKVLMNYTNTVIGTPHYIAPEILLGKGYSLSCDFWSLGICVYEMFYGLYPFGHYANEVIEVYKDIVYKDYTFPSENIKFTDINMFIKDLLQKKVNQRICNVPLLKGKPFFKDFEWDKLNDFQLHPPFIPGKNKDEDYLRLRKPFEPLVQENKIVIVKKDGDVPSGYNSNWAEEF